MEEKPEIHVFWEQGTKYITLKYETYEETLGNYIVNSLDRRAGVKYI